MSEQNKIQLFENQPIRTAWNEEQEEWYFSVVDVIHVLTGSENPRRYWSDLKRKLKSEGATQLYENIVQLKMKSSDGIRPTLPQPSSFSALFSLSLPPVRNR